MDYGIIAPNHIQWLQKLRNSINQFCRTVCTQYRQLTVFSPDNVDFND